MPLRSQQRLQYTVYKVLYFTQGILTSDTCQIMLYSIFNQSKTCSKPLITIGPSSTCQDTSLENKNAFPAHVFVTELFK